MGEIKIVRATVADRPRLVDFLRASFYPYEPLNIAMGLTDEPSEDDVDHSLQHLPQGNSLIALLDGVIVGAAINGEINVNEIHHRQKQLDECQCPDFSKFLKFWVHVEKEANFWKRHDVTRAFDLEILAVGVAARGRGVGKRLLEETLALGKELGFEMMRVDCSSFYAAQLTEKQGMKCVYELHFADYKGENDEVVFKTFPPHETLKIYMKKL